MVVVNRRSSVCAFFLYSLLVVTCAHSAEVYTGKVVSIADGDTLTILVDNRQIKVRLASIDTPEMGQPFGKQSKQQLAALAFGKIATVVEVDWDRYGRLVGTVFISDTDINSELVRTGYAWVYRKYSKDPQLLELESIAREVSLGLWSQSNPIAPWEWRKGKRGADASTATGVIGNQRSKIYHLPECPDYLKIAEHNRVPFDDEDIAVREGFRKAGNCP